MVASRAMLISDVVCFGCGAEYMVAESAVAESEPGQAVCRVCSKILIEWHDRKLRAVRLVLSPHHKYPRFWRHLEPGTSDHQSVLDGS